MREVCSALARPQTDYSRPKITNKEEIVTIDLDDFEADILADLVEREIADAPSLGMTAEEISDLRTILAKLRPATDD